MCPAWIITCILFVFGALSGYAGLLFKKNRLTAEDHEVTRCVSMTKKIVQFNPSPNMAMPNFQAEHFNQLPTHHHC